MLIEVIVPASLPLGLVKLNADGQETLCWLGLTLQQPRVELSAQAAAGLNITGARADVAHQRAARFFDHHQRAPQGQVVIEHALPRAMGLSSGAMLGLGVARALAWVNGLPLDDTPALARAIGLGPEQGLAVFGFERGGLLLVEAQPAPGARPRLLRRAEISHADPEAWVIDFYLTPTNKDTPAGFQAERQAALLAAAPHLSAETGRLVDEQLWPAVAQDDLPAFAHALMALQAHNQAALAEAGRQLPLAAADVPLLDLMRAEGALAWGRTATGLALYGLVRGAPASLALRRKLNEAVGLFSGTVMAAITDNRGATHTEKDEAQEDNRFRPMRLRN